jgi:hypothetical protein
MIFNQFNDGVSQGSERISLRTVLVILSVLQILGTVGLIGYFSFKNGQQNLSLLWIIFQGRGSMGSPPCGRKPPKSSMGKSDPLTSALPRPSSFRGA